MICFRDMTFCEFYLVCKNGYKCERALTPDIRARANRCNLPIAYYGQFPECFIRFFEGDTKNDNRRTYL